jgi:hypothetical protein
MVPTLLTFVARTPNLDVDDKAEVRDGVAQALTDQEYRRREALVA